jgi:hypothetical protein
VAGYSGTPLPRKLGVKPDSRIALLGAPVGFSAALAPLPPDVAIQFDTTTPADVILLFAADAASLPDALRDAMYALVATGGLWIVWPKRAARVDSGLSEHVVRQIGLAAGLVDNKVCAIDETWSALRFVVRVAERAKWPVR